MWLDKEPRDDFDFERYVYRYKVWYSHRVVNLDPIMYMHVDDFEHEFCQSNSHERKTKLQIFNPYTILRRLQERKGWLQGTYETDDWIYKPKYNRYGIPCLQFYMKNPVVFFNPSERDIRQPDIEEECINIRYEGRCYKVASQNYTNLIYITNIEYKPK